MQLHVYSEIRVEKRLEKITLNIQLKKKRNHTKITKTITNLQRHHAKLLYVIHLSQFSARVFICSFHLTFYRR